MAEPEIGDVLADITADIQTIIKGEIQLAKAELVPQAKRITLGVGLFGAAGYLLIQVLTLLFICGGLAFTALYEGGVGIVWAFCLGFLTMTGITLLVAAVLALIGWMKFQVKGPEATIANAQQSVDAVTNAISRGQANVRAIAAGADRASIPVPAAPRP